MGEAVGLGVEGSARGRRLDGWCSVERGVTGCLVPSLDAIDADVYPPDARDAEYNPENCFLA